MRKKSISAELMAKFYAKVASGQITPKSFGAYVDNPIDCVTKTPTRTKKNVKAPAVIVHDNPWVAKTVFNWPGCEPKDVRLDFEQILSQQQGFFDNYGLQIPNADTMAGIWQKNYPAIVNQMQTLGYDGVLMLPNQLLKLPELHALMTSGYNESWQGPNFREGGSFAGVVDAKNQRQGNRIVLLHRAEEMNMHPVLQAMLGKSPVQLIGKTQEQIECIITQGGNLKINYTTPEGKKIIADGTTLRNYLMFQQQMLNETNVHIDSKYWTWLLASYSARRLVYSFWLPDSRQLYVYAFVAGNSADVLGCRPSCCFS